MLLFCFYLFKKYKFYCSIDFLDLLRNLFLLVRYHLIHWALFTCCLFFYVVESSFVIGKINYYYFFVFNWSKILDFITEYHSYFFLRAFVHYFITIDRYPYYIYF